MRAKHLIMGSNENHVFVFLLIKAKSFPIRRLTFFSFSPHQAIMIISRFLLSFTLLALSLVTRLLDVSSYLPVLVNTRTAACT